MTVESLNAPAPDASATPAAAVTPSAPIAEVVSTPAPAAVEAPAAAPVVEATPDPAPAEETSLLGADEPAPADAPKENTEAQAEVAKEEVSQSDEPAPLPTFDAFTIPDDVALDEGRLTGFTTELASLEAEMSKDPAQAHTLMQQFGQKMVDEYIAGMKDIVARTQEAEKIRKAQETLGWKDDFIKNTEIGGNRQETTLKAATEFLKVHGGNAEQQKELREILNKTGVGNHPALIRLMANAQKSLKEGSAIPAQKPDLGARSKIETRYGRTG